MFKVLTAQEVYCRDVAKCYSYVISLFITEVQKISKVAQLVGNKTKTGTHYCLNPKLTLITIAFNAFSRLGNVPGS